MTQAEIFTTDMCTGCPQSYSPTRPIFFWVGFEVSWCWLCFDTSDLQVCSAATPSPYLFLWQEL